MPPVVHKILQMVEAHPLMSLLVLIAGVLYVRLMTSDPRPY